jgi:hypothetical protein
MPFLKRTMPEYVENWHHTRMADALDRFINREIPHLMVFIPPQHGKSEQCSVRFPAFILGKDPNRKIAGVSYNDTKAKKFNLRCRRVMEGEQYQAIFPETKLKGMPGTRAREGSMYTKSMNLIEVLGHKGSYQSVGMGGPLTGESVDILILDDMVKDRAEAMSRSIQYRNNEWLDAVGKSRLDNDGQILLVNTRWCKDDPAGKLLNEMLDDGYQFEVLSFPAIKYDDSHNNGDPRKKGEALWPEKHSLERLEMIRKQNPAVWEALYQQNPQVPTELLVYGEKPWTEISKMPTEGGLEFYGIDFGFSTSFDVLMHCLYKDGGRGYVDELLYQKNLGSDTLIQKVKMNVKPGVPIYADSSEARMIEDMQRAGLNVIPARKGQGSVKSGIFFIQSLDMHYTKRSQHTKYEHNNYKWPPGPDGSADQNGNPVKEDDHAMDAIRMGFYSHVYHRIPTIIMGRSHG